MFCHALLASYSFHLCESSVSYRMAPGETGKRQAINTGRSSSSSAVKWGWVCFAEQI